MAADPDDPDGVLVDFDFDLDSELLLAVSAASASVQARAPSKRASGAAPSALVGERESGDSQSAATVQVAESGSSEPSTVEAQRLVLELRLRESAHRVRSLEGELAQVMGERDRVDRQFRELREAAVRSAADADLGRIRVRKEREDVERAAEERVLRAVFDIVENVDRGLAHASQDPARVAAGLSMVAEQFKGMLRRLDVQRIATEPGTPFDPAHHEALMYIESSDVPAGTVVNEIAPGFLLRGRMVRAARVVVARPLAAS